jgi:hypothetical protein
MIEADSTTAQLTRCGGCGQPPGDQPLRRGRCSNCYEKWVRARPVGAGAGCVSCGNRRRDHLRHYEVGLRLNAAGGRWTVLCHNCASAADKLRTPPRSVDALCERLSRDRRWHDRRYDLAHVDPHAERRAGDERHDRRLNLRELFDATELAEELVIELEADYEQVTPEQLVSIEDVTGIHMKTTEDALLTSPSDDLFLE